MKVRKVPHIRVFKAYPPTFGCSACTAVFEGPKSRKGLAREFADHVRQQHLHADQYTETTPGSRSSTSK